MDIVLYPSPVLKKKTETVTNFGPEIEKTAREMLNLMYKLRGVGLAAPQVGLGISMLVLNPKGKPEAKDEELILINPKIVSRKGEVYGEEGCLSFPQIYAEIARAKQVVVDYQDVTGKQHQKVVFEDWVGRIVQHENDHLEGVLFLDRMSPADKARVRNEIKALEEQYASARAGNS